MAACTGKYKLTQSENFEEFMKALGVGLVTRKLGNKSSPTVTITEAAGEYTFKQESLVKTSRTTFTLGQQFQEKTVEGKTVMSTISETAPNVLAHERLECVFFK